MFRLKLKHNCFLEINNLLAKHQNNITEIDIDHILLIAQKYKIQIHRYYFKERSKLIVQYIDYCLYQSTLDIHNIQSLQYLRFILFLNDNDIKKIILQKKELIHASYLEKKVYDHTLYEHELLQLEKIQNLLSLSDNLYHKITNIDYTNHNLAISNHTKESVLTPEEIEELSILSGILYIPLKYNEQTHFFLDRYRLYWRIENDLIPSIHSDIHLKNEESLYFQTSVQYLIPRIIKKQITSTDTIFNIKNIKGSYYRSGSISSKSITDDTWQLVDEGTIYLTNHKIYFISKKQQQIISISKQINIVAYNNGVDLEIHSTKHIFLEFNHNIDIFCMILSHLMAYN